MRFAIRNWIGRRGTSAKCRRYQGLTEKGVLIPAGTALAASWPWAIRACAPGSPVDRATARVDSMPFRTA
jgi:hypothetical protein